MGLNNKDAKTRSAGQSATTKSDTEKEPQRLEERREETGKEDRKIIDRKIALRSLRKKRGERMVEKREVWVPPAFFVIFLSVIFLSFPWSCLFVFASLLFNSLFSPFPPVPFPIRVIREIRGHASVLHDSALHDSAFSSSRLRVFAVQFAAAQASLPKGGLPVKFNGDWQQKYS